MSINTRLHSSFLESIELDQELKDITEQAIESDKCNPFMKGSLQWDAWQKGECIRKSKKGNLNKILIN